MEILRANVTLGVEDDWLRVGTKPMLQFRQVADPMLLITWPGPLQGPCQVRRNPRTWSTTEPFPMGTDTAPLSPLATCGGGLTEGAGGG